MVNKYLAQEKRVFDISKFTVVGSPTITSDGIASGFSSSDRIHISNVPTFDKPFKITFKVTTGDLTSKQSAFYSNGGNYYNAISVYGGTYKYFAVALRLSDNTDEFLQVLNVNSFSNYTGYFQWTGEKYILHIDDLGESTYNSSSAMSTASNTTIKLGCLYTNEVPFTGSIDLTQFSITVDGQTVFTGTKPVRLLERRKEGFDLSKFTVVGTPTITEDGVASGFTDSDYITLPISLSNANSWKIILKNNTLYSDGYLFGGNLLNTIAYTRGTFWISSNGTSWDVASSVGTRTNIPANSLIQLEFTGTKYIAKYSVDNGSSWVVTGELTSNIKITSSLNTLFIGKIINGTPANCSIDLKQFSITVDGKEVFTGAKENFYVMRK